jgi:hypothetical protein
MFTLTLIAAAGVTLAAKQPNETDCRPQIILMGNGGTIRDTPPSTDRRRTQRQPQPVRTPRPCIILTSA